MNLSTFVLSGIPLLIQHYADEYQRNDLSKTLIQLEEDFHFPRIKSYDFIIVGAGTAGCLLAGRLSERFNVLLLEEGGTPVPATRTGTPYNVRDHPAINNEFKSLPQKYFSPNTDGITKTYTGRMLGGTGSHNANVYNRGSPRDYDNWANITRDDSWKYQNVLKYFKQVENFIGILVNANSDREGLYGHNGPLTVDTLKPPVFENWLSAGAELGYTAGDPNGHQRESFTTLARTVKNGERDSTYTAFIKGIESSRESLTVVRYAQVDKILIEDGAAYGVVYRRHGIPQIAHSRHEVILSAGTFASPLLLIRSGIGPKAVLKEAKIPITMDLPGVGSNLWDHVAVFLQFISNNATSISASDKEIQDALFQLHSTQLRGNYNAFHGMQAFISSSRAKAQGQGDWPDIQFMLMEPLFNGKSKYTLMVGGMRPKSVGRMVYNISAHLAGETDLTKLGNPDFCYFCDKSDMNVMVEGIRLGIKALTQTTPFRSMNLSLDQTTIPEPCKGVMMINDSDEFWDCFVQRTGRTVDHLAGTCKMGNQDDPMAVVDNKLRVRGVRNLRVVDASVMPVVTNSNSNAPTILIAEKTAGEIIQEHSRFLWMQPKHFCK